MKIPTLGNNIAVHCAAEEQAYELLSYLESSGIEWYHGGSLTKRNMWNIFREKTCYNFIYHHGITYSRLDETIADGREIIEFEDLDIANRSMCEPISEDDLMSLLIV